MENSILIEKLTKEELAQSIRAIIREELEEFKNTLPELINEDDLLTRKCQRGRICAVILSPRLANGDLSTTKWTLIIHTFLGNWR